MLKEDSPNILEAPSDSIDEQEEEDRPQYTIALNSAQVGREFLISKGVQDSISGSMSLFVTLLTTSPVPQLGQQSEYLSGLLPHVSYDWGRFFT